MQSDRKNWIPRCWMATAIALAAAGLLSACAGPATSISKGNTPQQQRAMAMWQERCKNSGEFIHKTVEGVEGIYLVNVRTSKDHYNQGESPEDQFRLSDPYGEDATGNGYVETFLRDSIYLGDWSKRPANYPPRRGYKWVEAIDPEDGKLYRFTGHVEEPWQHDRSYLKGYMRFALDRTPIVQRTARYGVKFEDISTRDERENWIAGSSLKVIDLDTGDVLGERVGYMVDWAQGSRAGARQPWTFAADNACPAFAERYHFDKPLYPVRGSGLQTYQTLDFTEQVLRPQF